MSIVHLLMGLREGFKEHYLLESSRRNELTSTFAVPVGIVTVVLGVLEVVGKELHPPFDIVAIAQLLW